VEGLREEAVGSAAEALAVFARGSQARRVDATPHNARSSRSHAIFTLQIEAQYAPPPLH